MQRGEVKVDYAFSLTGYRELIFEALKKFEVLKQKGI
jgi:hypothetical protein